MVYDEPIIEDWEFEEEPFEEGPPRLWRRRLIIGVAVIVVIAMALVPLYNIIDRGQLPVADNGLELCGFDYCIVQEGVRNAGVGPAMSRLANTYLPDSEAEQLAVALLDHLKEDPVNFVMVDHLDRRISGQYFPDSRTIFIERPARAWIVVHEVAHTVASGHGEDFQTAVVDLVNWLESLAA